MEFQMKRLCISAVVALLGGVMAGCADSDGTWLFGTNHVVAPPGVTSESMNGPAVADFGPNTPDREATEAHYLTGITSQSIARPHAPPAASDMNASAKPSPSSITSGSVNDLAGPDSDNALPAGYRSDGSK
jgi:hypothetical protein